MTTDRKSNFLAKTTTRPWRTGRGIAATAIASALTMGTAFAPTWMGFCAEAIALTAYDTTNATVIDVSETPEAKIVASGTYVITGTCSEGHITVKKGTTGVTLVLRDLDLTCSTTAPLAINKENGSTIVAIEGTVRLTDKEDPARDADENDDDYEGACIKCKDGSDLILTGNGTLTLDGSADKNGIKVADAQVLTIESGTYDIASANDGIHAGSAMLLGGNIVVASGDDGIKAEQTLTIGADGTTGSTILVEKATEGMEGASVEMRSGNVAIHATDDGVNATNSDLTGVTFEFASYGGRLYVDAQGDGIDSNGNISTHGGTIEIHGSGNGGNAAMDFGDGGSYKWVNEEATVLAIGFSSMAVTPAQGLYAQYGQSGMGGGMGTPGSMGEAQGQPGQQGQVAPAPASQSQADQASQMGRGQSQQMPQRGTQGGQMGQQRQAGQPEMTGQFGGVRESFPDAIGATGSQQSQMGQPGASGQMASGSIAAGDTILVRDSSGNVAYVATALRNADSAIYAYPASLGQQNYEISVSQQSDATGALADLAFLTRMQVLGASTVSDMNDSMQQQAVDTTPQEQQDQSDTSQASETPQQNAQQPRQPNQGDQGQQGQETTGQNGITPSQGNASSRKTTNTGTKQKQPALRDIGMSDFMSVIRALLACFGIRI